MPARVTQRDPQGSPGCSPHVPLSDKTRDLAANLTLAPASHRRKRLARLYYEVQRIVLIRTPPTTGELGIAGDFAVADAFDSLSQTEWALWPLLGRYALDAYVEKGKLDKARRVYDSLTSSGRSQSTT